jgi:hypothetical protein
MLNALFGSEARVKILNLFLLHPEERYYLRQVARELNLQVNSVRRELENMVKFDLLKAEKISSSKGKTTGRSDKRYFSVNKIFILYPEIKALLIKAQILSSQKFLNGLQKICQPKFLALTGLFTNYPEAQTDILIVGTVRRSAFLKLIKDLEKDLAREINFTIMDEREFRYRREIMDIFLYTILEGKTVVLLDNTLKSK